MTKWKIKDIEKATGKKLKLNTLSFGIDIALNVTGWVLLKTTKTQLIFLDKGIIDTKKYKVITDKLDKIEQSIKEITITNNCDKVGVVEMPWVGFNPRGAIVLGISAGVAYNEIRRRIKYTYFLGASSARKKVGLTIKKGKNNPENIKAKKQAGNYVEEIFKIKEINDFEDDNIADCFDDKTEILTDDGWKFFKDLDKTNKVMSMNPETEIANYYPIKNIIIQKYKGNMYEYTSSTFNFCVTPNHELLIRSTQIPKYIRANKKSIIIRDKKRCFKKGTKKYSDRGKWKWHFSAVKDIHTTYWWIKRTCKWIGLNLVNYKIPAENFFYKLKTKYKSVKGNLVSRVCNRKYTYQENNMNMEHWLEFLGWYISEGNLQLCRKKYNSVAIGQNYPKAYKIIDIIKKLGYNPKIYNRNKKFASIVINNKQLAQHLLNICYVNKENPNCYNKKVPEFIKVLSPKLINIFLKYYCEGDGWISRARGIRQYSTSSKQLADDVQELILKTGKLSSIVPRTNDVGRKCFIVDHWTATKHINYVVSELKYTDAACLRKQLKQIKYDGTVYCVETEPYHTILVRRNDQVMWSGNSCILSLAGLIKGDK